MPKLESIVDRLTQRDDDLAPTVTFGDVPKLNDILNCVERASDISVLVVVLDRLMDLAGPERRVASMREVLMKFPTISHLMVDIKTCIPIVEFINRSMGRIEASCGSIDIELGISVCRCFGRNTLIKLLNSPDHIKALQMISSCDVKVFCNDELIEVFGHLKYKCVGGGDGERVDAKRERQRERNQLVEKIYRKLLESRDEVPTRIINFVFTPAVLGSLYRNGNTDMVRHYSSDARLPHGVAKYLITRVLDGSDFETSFIVLERAPELISTFYSSGERPDNLLLFFVKFALRAKKTGSGAAVKWIPRVFTRAYMTKAVLDPESAVEALTACVLLVELGVYRLVPLCSTFVGLLNTSTGDGSDIDFCLVRCFHRLAEVGKLNLDPFKYYVPKLETAVFAMGCEIVRLLAQVRCQNPNNLVSIHRAYLKWFTIGLLDSENEVVESVRQIFAMYLSQHPVFKVCPESVEPVVDFIILFPGRLDMSKFVGLLIKYTNPKHFYGIVEAVESTDLIRTIFQIGSTFDDLLLFLSCVSEIPPCTSTTMDDLALVRQCDIMKMIQDVDSGKLSDFLSRFPRFKYASSLAAFLDKSDTNALSLNVLHQIFKNYDLDVVQFRGIASLERYKLFRSGVGDPSECVDIEFLLDCGYGISRIGVDRFIAALKSVETESDSCEKRLDFFYSELVQALLADETIKLPDSLVKHTLKNHVTHAVATDLLATGLTKRAFKMSHVMIVKLMMSHSRFADVLDTNFAGMVRLLDTALNIEWETNGRCNAIPLSMGLVKLLSERYTYTASELDSRLERILWVAERDFELSFVPVIDMLRILSRVESKTVMKTIESFDVHQKYNEMTELPNRPQEYSMRFLLSLVAHLVADEKCNLETLIDRKLLGVPIRCLSSTDSQFRNISYRVLSIVKEKFDCRIEKSQTAEKPQTSKSKTHKSFGFKTGSNAAQSASTFSSGVKARNHVYYVFTYIESAIRDADKPLPSVITVFGVHLLNVARNPGHPLYSHMMKFMLSRPRFDSEDVPMFYELFYQTFSDNAAGLEDGRDAFVKHRARAGRKFIVSLVRHCYTSIDFECLKRRRVLELLLTCGEDCKDQIMAAYSSFAAFASRNTTSDTLILNILCGLISRGWINSAEDGLFLKLISGLSQAMKDKASTLLPQPREQPPQKRRKV